MKLFSPPTFRTRIAFFLIALVTAGAVLAAGGVQPDGTTRTSTDRAQNGVPVVEIAPPNAHGVSRNSYTDFNVNPKGLILNNADSVGISQLGGALPPNPHFHVGEGASIILNEVRSTRPSSLNGFSEIFGRRAEFILANPNGITCDGCGFINTSRATLITGSENDPTGAVGRFTLGPGNIAIQGAGLYGDNLPYVDLISRAVQVQARLQAGARLAVRTGNDQYDHASDAVSSTPATASAPVYAIDADQLGSMYAGQIVLITTRAGVGVRTAAPVIAQDSVYMNSAGGLDTAQVQADNTMTLRAQGVLRQQGAYQAAKRIDLEAATLSLGQPISADQDLRLVQTRGDWAVPTLQGGTGRTEITASMGSLQFNAPVFAAGDLVLSGKSITNTSQLAAHGTVALNTTGNITNAAGALVFAGRDLSVQVDGSLNNRGELYARGGLALAGLSGARMKAFTNRAGRVESGGDMYIAADQVLNTHNFASSASPTAFGQTNRPAVRQPTGHDWHTGQTNWVEATNPGLQRGLIQSNGNLAITATNFTNDLSDVFAAGNIAITVAKLNNHAYALRNAYTATKRRWGKTGSHCRFISFFGSCVGGHVDDYGWITDYYQAIGNTGGILPATIQAGGALSVNATQQINNATLVANAPGVSGALATTDPLAGLILPGEGELFRPNPAPSAVHPYLIETDPRLIDVKRLLGSTYFLQRIGYRPGKNVTLFLGDAAYDQRLIANQVRATAGGRFLFATARTGNAQYQRLVDQAAAERGRLGLALGKALTREQIAGLTSDILWYVQTEVAGQKVLAPRLYLSPQTRQRLVQARAARLSGTQVALNARDLLNQGTISATNDLAIKTRGDLINRGGRISAGTDLVLSAGGALRSESVAWRVNAGADIRSAVIRMAGLSARRDLHLVAGGDLTLTAATLAAGRDASLDAGAQLALNAIALTNRRNTRQGNWNITDTRIRHATTQLTVGRNLALNAGRSLRVEGAQVQAGGDVQLQAGGDVQLLAVQDSHHRVATRTGYSGFFDSTKKTTTITTETTQQQGAAVQSGGVLSVRSGGDIVLLASHTGSGGDIRFDTRGGNIALLAGKNTDYYRYKHTSDGLIYTKQQDRGHYTERLAASTAQSGGALHLGTGAGIGVGQNAQRGDIVVAGATLSSGGAMDFGTTSPGTEDTGLAGVSSASGADGHVLRPSDAERVGNLRIASVGLENHTWNYTSEKLNGFAAALVGVGALIDPIGGTLIAGLGLDLQKVDRVDDQTIHQQGANVAASGTLAAYTRGDITVSGSRVHAGGQATLDADGNVHVLAAVDRHTHQETHSIARIKGASINWDGSRLSAGIDGEYRKTEQSQTQLTQQGAQLDASSNLNIRAAGEVTVAASRLQAGQDLSVHTDKGLSILSTDDVQKQAEQQTRAKLRLSVGVGNGYNDFARSITAYKRAKAQRRAAQQALADFDTELQTMQAEVNAGKATADDLRLRREDRKYYVANLALAKVNEATAGVQIAQAGERAVSSTVSYGFYVDAMLEMHGSQGGNTAQQTASVASSLIAGHDLGLSAGTDLDVQGSDLGAGRNLTLTAANDTTIEAARNTDSRSQDRRSVSYQYSMGTYGVSAGSGGWNVGVSAGFDRSDGTTWRNARLSANGTLAIHTGRDTAIAGAKLDAADLAIDTGRNLDITSRQNTTYARGQDAGLNVGTGRGGVNAAHRNEDRRWTDTPTTLIGRQRVAITTSDTTTITGALVAQIDANGNDGGQLNLRTRRLTVRDLTDTSNTNQWNAGLSADLGTDPNPVTGGGVPNSAKTRIQLGFAGHVGGQFTRATLGQGGVLISDDQADNTSGLNRAIGRFQSVTANRNTGGLNTNVTIDHRMLSVEGWKDIGNNVKHTVEFGGDIVEATKQVMDDPRLHLLNLAQVLRSDTVLRQAKNGLAKTAQGWAVLAALSSHSPVREQQGLIGLGHYLQATYGLKLSDILFYNAKQTTSASLRSTGQRTVFGATVVDPHFLEYHSIFLSTTAPGLTKRGLAATLGHETSHLDYALGHGYLLFTDGTQTQEGLADAAGQRLTQLLGEQSPGLWNTGNSATWQQGMVDSPYTRLGTQRANLVGDAPVKYRQLRPHEIDRIRLLAKRWSESSGGAVTQEQASARLIAAGCAMVDCAAGFPSDNPAQGYYQKLAGYGSQLTKEKALLVKQKYTYKDGETEIWAVGANLGGYQTPLFTYTLGDKVDDGLSRYQVGTRALGGLEAAAGVVGVVSGAGLGGVGCETGVGCFAAAGLATYSADHAYAGAKTLWSGEQTPTALQSVLSETGLSPNTVTYIDGMFGLLTGVGTLSPASLNFLAPVTRAGAMEARVLAPEIRAADPEMGSAIRGEVTRGDNVFAAKMQGGGVVTKGVSNPVPGTVARVVADTPITRASGTLGRPGAGDVFVTGASDIRGLNAKQIAERLTIPESPTGFRVIEFPTPKSGIASPINRVDPGFIGGGRTAGGAREFVIPNGSIPLNASTRVVR